MTRDARRAGAASAALALACVAVYGRTLGFDFVNTDDGQYIVEHAVVREGWSLAGLRLAFTGIHHGNWHPLTTLSQLLDCELYGLAPWGHHLGNVALHAAVAVALFRALFELTGRLARSAAVAGLFALHPLRVESVAWVSGRKDLLSGLCFALALHAHARLARAGAAQRRRWLAAVAGCFALGLMSKPVLVTLPCVLLLLDVWPLGRLRSEGARALVAEKLPLFGLAAVSSALTVWAQRGAVIELDALPLPARLLNALLSVEVYLRELLWPAGLSPFYPHPGGLLSPARALPGALIVAGMLALGWRLRERAPYVAVGWLWFLGMLVPVLGIVQVGAQAHADRYTYLPQIGLCWAAVWGVADLWSRAKLAPNALVALAIALLALLGALSARQVGAWRDSESLWRRALAVDPRNHVALFGLARERAERGLRDEAAQLYAQAIAMEPRYPEARANLGVTLIELGRLDEGIEQLRAAVELRPQHARSRANLGRALAGRGELDAGLRECRRALELAPEDALVRETLALVLLARGLREEGRAEYLAAEARATAQRDPGLAAAIRARRVAAEARVPRARVPERGRARSGASR